MTYKGESPQPANLSEQTLLQVQNAKGEWIMVRDKKGNLRVLRTAEGNKQ